MKIFRSAHSSSSCATRKGVAAVEFAVVAPIFMMIMLGVIEMGRALDVTTNLAGTVREAGRFAAMHANGRIPPGTTTVQKVTQDMRNVLKANGIDGERATISITHADGPNVDQPFDLDASSNYLQYFKIAVSINYNDVSYFPLNIMQDQTLRSEMNFRLGKR